MTVDDRKRQYPLRWKGDGMKPQYVIQDIHRATRGEAIIVTEVGQNQMWAAEWYLCKWARQFISSGGLGTMGYGFPRGDRRGDRTSRPGGLGYRR